MPQQETLATFEMMDGDYDLDAYTVGDGEPVCAITAGIHGDETPSVEVAEALLDELPGHDLEGSVRIIPRANLFACSSNTRETPWPRYEEYESEERNLNRCFDAALARLRGEDRRLNLTQRVALTVLEAISDADYLIDMHTGTWPGKKVPQIRMKEHGRFADGTVDAMERMVRHSGLDHILRTEVSEIGSGVLAAVAPRCGVPAVTLEAGGPKHFSQDDMDVYIEAVENVLGCCDVLDRDPEPGDSTAYSGLAPVYTSTAGSLAPAVGLGDRIEEGEVVATIRDSHGEIAERIEAPVEGMVEMLNQRQAVNQGIRVAKIAYRD